MRNAFSEAIVSLAAADGRVVILSGDIGNRLFDRYKELFPDRFFNCGVAEGNMMSMAAGMALSGLRPFVYTITSFVTTRCYEQIRIDVCYHKCPVVIVGVGSGLSYSNNGPTHHSLEDIAIMRALPEMTVICPGDAKEVMAALPEVLNVNGPVYLRLGKKGEPVVHVSPPKFIVGESIKMREGNDLCLLSTGNTLPLALKVAEILSENEIEARVDSMHTVKPINANTLAELAAQYKLIVTLEEHGLIGGFGAGIAEWLSDNSAIIEKQPQVLRFGTGDFFLHEAGEQEHARECFQLSPETISAKITARLEALPR